jgi:hypothetical protein
VLEATNKRPCEKIECPSRIERADAVKDVEWKEKRLGEVRNDAIEVRLQV